MKWKTIKIGDFGEVITGNTPPKGSLEFYGKEYKFIKPTDMEIGMKYTRSTEEYYSEEGYKKYEKSVIPPLSTCVVTIGSIGKKMTLTDDYCFVNQAVNAVVPNPKKYDPHFVFYALRNILHKIKAADTGASSGRENVSKSNFSGLTLEVPERFETQQKIASILSAYDDAIENNLRRIRLLEEAAQHLYREWFVRFRFPGWEEVKVVDGLPEGWERKRADEVFEISIGKTPPRKESQWFEDGISGIKWVSIRDMNASSAFISETSESITSEGVNKFNMNIAPSGTVILSFKLSVGAVSIVTEDMVTNEAIAHFKIQNVEKMNSFFTYWYLKNFNFETLGSTSSIGTAINSKIVKSLPFLVPKKEVIQHFEKVMYPFFGQIKNLLSQNQHLKSARDLLLPRLMNQTIEV